MRRIRGVLSLLLILMGLGLAHGAALGPYELDDWPIPPTHLDELVLAELAASGIAPANPCSDAVFVRRVYLDVIGALPEPRAAWAFQHSDQPDKRSALIDALLASERFADYWSLKWCDVLRVKAEFPINLWPNAVQAYHRWVRGAIRSNMP